MDLNRLDYLWVCMSDCIRTRTHNHLICKRIQLFGQIGEMTEQCCEYLSVRHIWLYVLIMSRAHFRVNPHSIVAWVSRNSLLKTDTISEVLSDIPATIECGFSLKHIFGWQEHTIFVSVWFLLLVNYLKNVLLCDSWFGHQIVPSWLGYDKLDISMFSQILHSF